MASALMHAAGAALLSLVVASPHLDDAGPGALEELSAVLRFVEESAGSGGLVGADEASPERGVASLRARLDAAWDLAAAGDLEEACTATEGALERADGDAIPPDLVVGSAVAELHARLCAATAALCTFDDEPRGAP